MTIVCVFFRQCCVTFISKHSPWCWLLWKEQRWCLQAWTWYFCLDTDSHCHRGVPGISFSLHLFR